MQYIIRQYEKHWRIIDTLRMFVGIQNLANEQQSYWMFLVNYIIYSFLQRNNLCKKIYFFKPTFSKIKDTWNFLLLQL